MDVPIAHGAGSISLAPAVGVTPPSGEAPRHTFLSDAIVATGLVTEEQMAAALAASRSGRRYGEVLVDDGVLSDEALARVLAEHHRMDYVDLDAFGVDPGIARMLKRETARRLGALPIALLPSGEVVLAIHDPEALMDMSGLATLLGREVVTVVAARSQVERHIALPGGVEGGAPRAEAPGPALVLAPPPVEPAGASPAPEPARSPDLPSAPPVADPAPPVEAEPAADAAALLALAERLDAAERRAEDAVLRAEAAERRAAEAEDRAAAAEERAAAAQRQSDGMAATAQAANEALGQLAETLAAERTERLQLEAEMRLRGETAAAAAAAPVPAPVAPPPPVPAAAVPAPAPAPPPGAVATGAGRPPGPGIRLASLQSEATRKALGLRRMISALRHR